MNNLREEDVLFQKTYECPVCYEKFKSLTVRAGKLYSNEMDDDLRPIYRNVEPLKYEAIVCPHCGYGAFSRYFERLMPMQVKYIREEIQSKYTGVTYSTDKFSYEEAIERYKMVISSDRAAKVKSSRIAYTYLKLGWLIRSRLEHEGEELSEETQKMLKDEEMDCIKKAYDEYVVAFSSEHFPMSGMDELTLSFLVAELAYKLGQYDESMKMISKIFENKNAPKRVKDKAYELKERIRAQKKEEQ